MTLSVLPVLLLPLLPPLVLFWWGPEQDKLTGFALFSFTLLPVKFNVLSAFPNVLYRNSWFILFYYDWWGLESPVVFLHLKIIMPARDIKNIWWQQVLIYATKWSTREQRANQWKTKRLTGIYLLSRCNAETFVFIGLLVAPEAKQRKKNTVAVAYRLTLRGWVNRIFSQSKLLMCVVKIL